MSPLVFLVAGAAGLYLLAKKGAGRTEVVGPSNTHWLTESRTAEGTTYTQVFAKSGQFGPHVDTLVLTYATPVGQTTPRSLVSLTQGLPQTMVSTAIKDFNITVPEGMKVSGRRVRRF
jgi:hypothetical protein